MNIVETGIHIRRIVLGYGPVVCREVSDDVTVAQTCANLGLDVEDVTEIRCIAELDLLPPDTWLRSANWKKEKVRQSFKKPVPAPADQH